VVEYIPATDETRIRFPVCVCFLLLFWFRLFLIFLSLCWLAIPWNTGVGVAIIATTHYYLLNLPIIGSSHGTMLLADRFNHNFVQIACYKFFRGLDSRFSNVKIAQRHQCHSVTAQRVAATRMHHVPKLRSTCALAALQVLARIPPSSARPTNNNQETA
jgi:hypothetical protein